MLVDTHAHLNFHAFAKDYDEVVKRTLAGDVWVINIGSNYPNSEKAVEIAEKYPKGVFATVGLHPINIDTGLVKIKVDEQEGRHLEPDFDYAGYRKLAQSEKVVAIGEFGLDYYWRPKTTKKKKLFKQKQKELFEEQLKLAQELNLPVVLHCRMAHENMLSVLESRFGQGKVGKGVIHCFTGTLEQAERYMGMGFFLGFNGIIFKLDLDEIIKKTPLEKILVETDCPYLSPPSFGKERNEPLGVEYVARRIAEIKSISFERVEGETTENAKDLFGLF